MALRRPYLLNDTPTGNAVPNAYVRVAAVSVNERDQARITLHYWTSRAVYLAGGLFRPWKVDESYIIDPLDQNSASNLKTQVYNWLKTQAEFSAAQDE